MKNRLVVIGWLGSKTCYLNVDIEEAKRRYIEQEGPIYDDTPVDIVEFDDQFDAYSVWHHPKTS